MNDEMKYTRVIGIDPDVDKSGVAEVHVETRKVNMASLTFPQLMDYLQYMQNEYGCKEDERMLVVVEAGWMNANNWHTSRGQSVAAAAKTGQNTGRNHEVARKIAEMARHYGMNVIEVKPLRKCWKGKDGKITHDELSMIIGGIDSRTNQEVRDACLISWVYAGLPIKISKL